MISLYNWAIGKAIERMETFLFINHNERSCAICYKCVEDLYLKLIALVTSTAMLQKKNCTTNFCFALFLAIFRLFFIPFWPIIVKNEWILGYTKGSLQKSFARVTSGCHQLFILFCILLPVLFISIVQASDRFHRVGWSPVQAFPLHFCQMTSGPSSWVSNHEV